jgi:hypothetical protein
MVATRYTVVLVRGSICTDDVGRTAILDSLRARTNTANVPVIDPYSDERRIESIDLLELITILKHDSGANPAVLKRLVGGSDQVVSLSDYTARRFGLSSVM